MNNLEISHTIIAILIGVIFPLFAMITGHKTREILDNNPEKLNAVFRSTAFFLLSLCTLVIVSMIYNQEDWSLIGLSFISDPLSVISLIVICMVSYFVLNYFDIPENKITSLKEGYKDIMYILPNNRKEYTTGIGISVVAGTCEEIMFRGFLYWQLNQYMPEIYSFFIVNLMFALGHAGTKLKNAVSTFFLGVIFSLAYILTDSLWLAILLHIIVDFYAVTLGFKLKKKLKQLNE